MELDEAQMPAGDTSTTAPAVTDAIMEQDTGYAPLVKVDTFTTNGVTISDPNPFFGRVAYTHGLTLDQPVSVNRYGYVENAYSGDSAHHFAPYELSPMWNAQGVVDLGLFGDGGAATCDQTGQTQRCTRKVLWLYALTAYWRSVNDQLSWQGTLLEDKQDGSGMVYRRARYLDPATGRFTQEDPIGLAGGLNLYGFAAGDPINFSDPFGLCRNDDNECKYLVKMLREHGGTVFRAAAKRYDALETGVVSFIAISQLSAWDQSQGVRGLHDDKGNVWLVGEASRADFLVTAVHESLHQAGVAEDDPELVNGVYKAYMQLSPEERATASFTRAWLQEHGRLKETKKPKRNQDNENGEQ